MEFSGGRLRFCGPTAPTERLWEFTRPQWYERSTCSLPIHRHQLLLLKTYKHWQHVFWWAICALLYVSYPFVFFSFTSVHFAPPSRAHLYALISKSSTWNKRVTYVVPVCCLLFILFIIFDKEPTSFRCNNMIRWSYGLKNNHHRVYSWLTSITTFVMFLAKGKSQTFVVIIINLLFCTNVPGNSPFLSKSVG